MRDKFLYAITLLLIGTLLQEVVESKKVVIHVPYHVKNFKHTHTIYKIVPHHHGHLHGRKQGTEDEEEDVDTEVY